MHHLPTLKPHGALTIRLYRISARYCKSPSSAQRRIYELSPSTRGPSQYHPCENRRVNICSLPSKARRALLRTTPAPLFHGTRYMSAILADDELCLGVGSAGVSLTRCPDVAAYHASNGPRDWDDGRGAIIVLDQDRLRAKYRRYPINDEFWIVGTEAEERVDEPVSRLSDCAVGYVWLDSVCPGIGLKEPRRVCSPERQVRLGPLTLLRREIRMLRHEAASEGKPAAAAHGLDHLLESIRPSPISELNLSAPEIRLAA